MHPYVEQHPDDLRLSYASQLDLKKMNVYKQSGCSFFNGKLRVLASIIGASHVLSFAMGNRELHEVFACVNLPNSLKLSEITGPIYEGLPGMRYEFSVDKIPWPHIDAAPPELDDLVAQAKSQLLGIVCEFEPGELGVTPITVITSRKTNDGLIITTGHAYPGTALVITNTYLQPYEER